MIMEFKNDYRWLSNFSPCNVTIDGLTYPSPHKGMIFSEQPIKTPEKKYKISLNIEIFDPRKVMHYIGNEGVVNINLIQKSIPEKPATLFYMVPTLHIETLQSYSFEDWDRVSFKDEMIEGLNSLLSDYTSWELVEDKEGLIKKLKSTFRFGK